MVCNSYLVGKCSAISRIIINGVWAFLEGRLKFFNELLKFIEYTFDKFVSFVENHID